MESLIHLGVEIAKLCDTSLIALKVQQKVPYSLFVLSNDILREKYMNEETLVDKSFEQEAQFDVFFKAIHRLKKFVETEKINASFALSSRSDFSEVFNKIQEKHNSLKLSLEHYWTEHRKKMAHAIVAHEMKRLHENTDVMAVKYLHGLFQMFVDWPNAIKLYIMTMRTLLANLKDKPIAISIRKKLLEQYQGLFPERKNTLENFPIWMPSNMQAITKPMKLHDLFNYIQTHDTTTPPWVMPFKKQQFHNKHRGGGSSIDQLIQDFPHNVVIWWRVANYPVHYNTIQLTTDFVGLFNRGIHERFIQQSNICKPVDIKHTPHRGIEFRMKNRKHSVVIETLDGENFRLLQFPHRKIPTIDDLDIAKIKLFQKEVKPDGRTQMEIKNATKCMFVRRIADVENMVFDLTVIEMEVKTRIVQVLNTYNIVKSQDLTEEILQECSNELWKACEHELDSSEIQLSVLRECLSLETSIKKAIHNTFTSQKPKTPLEFKESVEYAINNLTMEAPMIIAKKKFILTTD